MIATIDENMDFLTDLCVRRRVRLLDVFGSAADGSFDPASSDLDFLVEFLDMDPQEHYESYFGLWEDLEALYHRKVDLVETRAMRNPYFIRNVNKSRKTMYTAQQDQS